MRTNFIARVALLVALLLVAGPGPAWGQERRADAPANPARLTQPLDAPTEADLRAYRPAERAAALALNQLCRDWHAAATRAEQDAMLEERGPAVLRQMQAGFGTGTGLLAERQISGDRAAATVFLGAGLFLATAPVGFLSFDSSETQIHRGAQPFTALAGAARRDIVMFRADMVRLRLTTGRCEVLTRFRQIQSLGPVR